MIKWLVRLFTAAFFAFIIGALPIYISSELKEISSLKSELKEIQTLNNKLFSELEESADKLNFLKTKSGMEKLLREHGYVPKGAKVYQLEKE